MSLQKRDSHASWEAIHLLRKRAHPDTVVLAQKLFKSRQWRKRELGINIISQLGQGRAGKRVSYALTQAHEMLLSGLKDSHPNVIQAAIVGFGHRPLPCALESIVHFVDHPNKDIRFAVAFALGSYQGVIAIDTLIKLARDPDTDTRDWATFALGSLHEDDTPEIRAVLRENLNDDDPDVRYEAEEGLALRQNKD